ncbi:MAG: hypothetical protein MJ002_02670 [Paludibacteraceae bacterium]|nr:hypothetical protein [Paludibacteraceae bacterium]
MRQTLLLLAALVLSVCTLNAQNRKKQKEEPIDNSYQVVNVTNEASVCYDTLSKKFDMVCYVTQNGEAKTVQVSLGTEFPEIMRNLMSSIKDYNVKRRTVDYVIKYFVLYRDMPMEGITLALDYCTDYALKLNLSVTEYEVRDIPVTFAISDPNGKEKLKQKISLSTAQILKAENIEQVKSLINTGFVKEDAETAFFLKITTPKSAVDQAKPAEKEDGKADKKDKKDKKGKK